MLKELMSTRAAAGEAVLELANEGYDVVAVSADTSKSMYTTLLREKYPSRCFETGIAEQNMMMLAAGMAATGRIAFAASYSVFTSMRCCEQIRTFIAYPSLNVKIIAGIGGLSAGIEGVTHVATEDLGIVRCIPNVTVIAPSDAGMTKKAVKAAADWPGPVYIRIGREESPVIHDEQRPFEIGKCAVLKNGGDITILACGLVLSEVLAAADTLSRRGVSVEVIEVHTLKPLLNDGVILDSLARTKKALVVEEHYVIGGLSTVLAEVIAGKGEFLLERISLNGFAQSGTPDELYDFYGMTHDAIVKKVLQILL